jgi:hypothetical protein
MLRSVPTVSTTVSADLAAATAAGIPASLASEQFRTPPALTTCFACALNASVMV